MYYRYFAPHFLNNPVKHGYVKRVMDWPYSSIHRYINQGLTSANWHFNGESSDILSHIRE